MKKPALTFLALTTLTILATSPASASTRVKNDIDVKSSGGKSSVSVDVKNNINGGNFTSKSTSTSKTDIEINQSGEGLSRVVINGKEYKVEGPGSLSVHESGNTTPPPNQNPSPTNTNTPTPQSASPTPTPTTTEAQSPTPTPPSTPQPTITAQVEIKIQGTVAHIKKFIEGILNNLRLRFD